MDTQILPIEYSPLRSECYNSELLWRRQGNDGDVGRPMRKILEASSRCLWEHQGMYCVSYSSLGKPDVGFCNWTESQVIRWAVIYPYLPQFSDMDAAIINYFGEDKVTMVMLECL